MTELGPRFSVFQASEVPVILVGQALDNCHPAAPPHMSRWNGRPVQLWKVRVRIERVLQGGGVPKEVDVFYFVDWGATESGWSRLLNIYAGHFEVLFLQKDGANLRTICEDSRSCVLWVRTGGHANHKTNPNLSIGEDIAHLLLSRGNETSDLQMIDAIYHADGRWGWDLVTKEMEHLLNDESPAVRAIASEKLEKLLRYGGHEPPEPNR